MRIKHSGPSLVEADMTPMIDMVFQLVAFFMIVTNFDQQQADERVKLPSDPLVKPPEVARKLELVLNVGFSRTPEGEIADPIAKLYFPGEDGVDAMFSRDRINQEGNVSKLRNESKDTVVTIRADADVPTGVVQKLIEFGQDAGYNKFALKAQTESGD